ncbi:MAG: AzlD domain-containing protein [Lentisphaeria bacterium]|nr:AzlD domain-containing protein [Lentisphaeria bacterium]MBR2642970.1 AzlD domain-containing protein [Lentisphaeria bacterium]
MTSTAYLFAIVLTAAAVTILLRSVPFLLFREGKPLPPVIHYISKMLSPAIIALLTFYCFGGHLQERVPAEHGFGIAELSAAIVVVGLQLWKRNPLLSILAGTAVYMIFIQKIFP